MFHYKFNTLIYLSSYFVFIKVCYKQLSYLFANKIYILPLLKHRL